MCLKGHLFSYSTRCVEETCLVLLVYFKVGIVPLRVNIAAISHGCSWTTVECRFLKWFGSRLVKKPQKPNSHFIHSRTAQLYLTFQFTEVLTGDQIYSTKKVDLKTHDKWILAVWHLMIANSFPKWPYKCIGNPLNYWLKSILNKTNFYTHQQTASIKQNFINDSSVTNKLTDYFYRFFPVHFGPISQKRYFSGGLLTSNKPKTKNTEKTE